MTWILRIGLAMASRPAFVDRPRVHLHWHLRRGQHYLVDAVCSQRDA